MAGMSSVMFPPLPLSFVAFLLDLIGVRRLVDDGQRNGGDADEAPPFVRLLDHLPDDQRHQSSDGSRPVSDCAGPVVPGIIRLTLVAVMWLWCALFHCTQRLCLSDAVVNGKQAI